MKEPALVTVIVPVYSGGSLAIDAINSLLAQTFTRMEILVVNDGSPLEVDREIPNIFGNKIRYVEWSNSGLCSSLNKAIFDLVDTPFVARLDQDDFAYPDRIALQMDTLSDGDVDGCFSSIEKITPSGRVLAIHPHGFSSPTVYDPRVHGSLVHSTLVAKTEFIRKLGGYNAEFYPCDDFHLNIKMSANGKILVHPGTLVRYLIHDGANTFSKFWDMQIKTQYLYRFMNDPERCPPYNEWFNSEGRVISNSWQQRVFGYGRLLYREGGLAIGEKRFISGFFKLGVAAVINPNFVYKRLTSTFAAVNRKLAN